MIKKDDLRLNSLTLSALFLRENKIFTNRTLYKSLGKLVAFFGIFFLFVVMFANNTLASTPNYELTDLIEEEMINGEIELGSLLFVKADYQSDIISMQEIENKTAQKFDTLLWQSSKSIKITPPYGEQKILVNGDSYRFDYQGAYIIESIINNTDNSIISILQENESKVNLEILEEPNGVEIFFQPKEFILNNEKTVNVTANIDDDLEPDDYIFKYQIRIPGKITNHTKTLTLKENINWTIKNSTLENKTYKTGDTEFFGFIELENNGNKNVDIFISKEGNQTHMIGIPQPQTLYKKSVLRLNFQVQIPTVQDVGEYYFELKINGGDLEKTIPLKFTIQDNIKPIIESINFSTDKVYKENKILVVSTDNNNVEKVLMAYDEKNVTLEKDGNTFNTTQVFKKLSKYEMEFCAYDDVNNSKCVFVNKTFKKDNVINISTSKIELPAKKIGKYSEKEFLNITKKIDEGVIFKLIEIEKIGSQDNYTPTIRIVDEDGSVKSFSQYDNEIKVTDSGIMKLQIRSDVIGDYQGLIRVELPGYIEEVEDISFEVSFKDYDVPEDFTMSWFDNRVIECNVRDTGDLETSYYDCNLEFPIDVKKEDLSFPTTVREKDKLDTEVGVVIEDLNNYKGRSATIITILLLLVFVVGGFSYYFMRIYPYARVKAKIKDK